jgi:hypothetical protein
MSLIVEGRQLKGKNKVEGSKMKEVEGRELKEGS